MGMVKEWTKTLLFIWGVRTVPAECLWHLMWCPRISHAVKAQSTPEELCRNPIFITFMDWGKKLFLHTSLLLSRPYTCHPHIHTLHSSCYLSVVLRIPGEEFIAVSHNVIRTYTISRTWCLWKVLSPGRIPYVIMFDFRLYFNHYIIFEICELRLYISPLSNFLVSSSPSFLPSTPVGTYSPSSRWEKAFPFRLFKEAFSPGSLWKCSPPETSTGRGFWGQIYTEAIVCLPIKLVYGGYIVLSDGFQKWASPGKTRPNIKTDLLMRTMHISPLKETILHPKKTLCTFQGN